MGFPNTNRTGAGVQIQYPSSLPYQIALPADGVNPTGGGSFSLHTVSVDDVGDAVSVVLGPAGAGLINGWTVILEGAAVATNGAETLFNLASSQLKIGSDGSGVAILAAENLGSPYDTFVGDAGKLVPSVSIAGGQVLLTFTPVGDPALTIYHGVTGTVASARG